ncbi:elongator protein 2 [Phyllosticta citrichinensis]|uniref:Elongator complex protein 2 n=1 Tax=Phyllosticta citrichinensis TaxID=1130410 RepID=A0ABR1XGV7_9PEZI
MVKTTTNFIAAGGNRNPSAADWDPNGSGLLAYGAGNNLALWNPLDTHYRGCTALLSGHTKPINVVKFFRGSRDQRTILLTGGADSSIRIWVSSASSANGFQQKDVLAAHSASINCIATLPDSDVFISGAADATIKVWRLAAFADESLQTTLLQTIDLRKNPKTAYFPLSISLARLSPSTLVFASAGTKNYIQIYAQDRIGNFINAATLKGHEDWIRSLNFTHENPSAASDLLLASASQDKFIRLWRFHAGETLPEVSRAADNPALGAIGKSLHNKAHRIDDADGAPYTITFEALLVGHEDWIYSAQWRLSQAPTSEDGTSTQTLQLLTTSADNSLAIWSPDPLSGIWVSTARLGEISATKGATTATGSTGGFWIGLWSPDGSSVTSLGRTGSWRLWSYHAEEDRWTPRVAVSGHVRAVKDLSWSPDGSYLLSTSSDQTTRQWAEWKRDGNHPLASYHEFSRPQIHGYDLNCLATLSPLRFLSGADEKLLRVFDQPASVAKLLENLCGVTPHGEKSALPDAANIPVLGLSNKAIDTTAGDLEAANGEAEAAEDLAEKPTNGLSLTHPPLEEHLSRHLLWPEHEKLYGHGYEINCVAATHDGALVATSCRATSVDHAAIRLYETATWRQVAQKELSKTTSEPTMKLHSLTVTGLAFSPGDSRYLLSVGRDRVFGLWERDEDNSKGYKLLHSQDKAHSRMLLGVSWAPLAEGNKVFATAGRDSKIKLWRLAETDGKTATSNIATVPATAPVTALSFCPVFTGPEKQVLLAYGTEKGAISLTGFRLEDLSKGEIDVGSLSTEILAEDVVPSDAITSLAWRPTSRVDGQFELAVSSDDGSVRIFRVSV